MNTTTTLGINNRVLDFLHKVMFLCMLYSSIFATSQTMLSDYFRAGEPLRYKGGDMKGQYDIDATELENDGIKNEVSAPKHVPLKSMFKNFVKDFPEHYKFKADIQYGNIGADSKNLIDDARDNIFKFNIDNIPGDLKAFLTYEIEGISTGTSVATSINDRYAAGGYLVKQQQGWSFQKEEIDISWLKRGENKIMFSVPKDAGYSYKVKNVQVNFEKSNGLNSALVLNTANISFSKNNKIYIKGFVRGEHNKLSVSAGATPLLVNDGSFEGLLTLDQETLSKQFIVVKATDENGFLGQDIIMLSELTDADKIFPIDNITNNVTAFFKTCNKGLLQTDGASLDINEEALKADTQLSISKLRYIDIAPLGSGMINVTKGAAAYRFLPDGTKFEAPVKIELEYDEKLLPEGYTSKDIKTFYFNTDSKSWVAVQRDTVAVEGNKIVSVTNHFTDYINGIIQAPESPETAGFTPTMMNDVKAADPSAEMTLISPPEVSQKGDANISYPIKIPAGRNGMQPSLAVQYSNEGGNGWLGQGWGINIPAISIDTRWGTPLLDPTNESEIYTLNGEQLMYPNLNGENWMPNRHFDVAGSTTTVYSTQDRPRIANAVFTPRKQGSFAKIERLGTNTTNYYWKVTTTDGTKHWYGGYNGAVVENAVIKNGNNIVHWGLYMTEDVHGNNVIYEYTPSTLLSGQSGANANLNGSRIFNIKYIYYTGHAGLRGKYCIEFKTKTTVREDVSMTARLGVKQAEPYFLDYIKIFKTNAPTTQIRKYAFSMGYGKLLKGRLLAVAEFNAENKEFYRHQFEYYDDLSVGGADVYYADWEFQTICNDVPPPPCPDADGDGVCDTQDQCPNQAGPANNNGCPQVYHCYNTSFLIPSSSVYLYDFPELSATSSKDTSVCFVSSSRVNALTVNNVDYSAINNNIFLIHGAGNDPAVSRCPSTPLTTTPNYIVKNPDYETRFINFLNQQLPLLNIQPFMINVQGTAYTYLSSSGRARNSISSTLSFRSVTNLADISYKADFGILNSSQQMVWFPGAAPIVAVKSLLSGNVNTTVYLNGSTVAIGTYDLNNAQGRAAFQNNVSSLYPGTTLSYYASPDRIVVYTSNPNLTSIKLVPLSTNIAQTYNLSACIMNRVQEESVSAVPWPQFKLSEEEANFGLYKSIADGKELELPLTDIQHYAILSGDNNDDYIASVVKNEITWYDIKLNELSDKQVKDSGLLKYERGLRDEYSMLNQSWHTRKIEQRKVAQQQAIIWIEDYYRKHKDIYTNIISQPTAIEAEKKNTESQGSNSSNNYFGELVNNFQIGYTGGITGDPQCPTFSNSLFFIPGSIPSFNSAGALLGSSASKSYTIGGHVGFGIDFQMDPTTKNITIGGAYNHSWDESESLTAMVDINGDGLDDMVFKFGSALYWKKHTLTRTYNSNNEPVVTHSFGGYSPIQSFNNEVKDFFKSDGESSSWNLQLNFYGFVGYQRANHKSRNNIYFTDANADGLVDIVQYGTVYFNRLNSSGNPYFEPASANTENMLIVAGPMTVTPPPIEEEETTDFDVVKVWEAPANGEIKIENNIVNNDPSKEVIVTIEKRKEIPPVCYSVSFPVPYVVNPVYNIHFGVGNFVYSDTDQCYTYNPTYSRVNDLSLSGNVYNTTLYSINGNDSGILNPTICPPYSYPDFSQRWTQKLNQTSFYITHPNIFSTQISNANLSDGIMNVPGEYFNKYYTQFSFSFQFTSTQPFIDAGNISSFIKQYDAQFIVGNGGSRTSYPFLVVGVPTYITIDGTQISTSTFNIYNNFTAFKQFLESQYPVEVTQDGLEITIRTIDEVTQLSSIILQAADNSFTNTYNFEEVDCNSSANKLLASVTEKIGPLSNYKPSKDEVNIAYTKFLAEGNHIEVDKESSIPFRYFFEAPENSLTPEKDAKYIFTIDIDGEYWEIEGRTVKDQKVITELNNKLPLDYKIQYLKWREEFFKSVEKSREPIRLEAIKNWSKIQEEELKKVMASNSATLRNQPIQPYVPCMLFGAKLNQSQPTITNIITAPGSCGYDQKLRVKKGDRIYFRVHNVQAGNPSVSWDPKVSYIDGTFMATTDQNGQLVYNSRYSDGFLLSQDVPVILPGAGTAQITWDNVTVANPTDEVKFEIIKRTPTGNNTYSEFSVFGQVCQPNQTTVVSSSNLSTFSITSPLTQFLFRVTSSSNVKWKAIEWKPKLTYTTTQQVMPQGASPEGTVSVTETKYPIVDYSIYNFYPAGPAYQAMSVYFMNGGNGLSITPTLNSNIFNSSDNGIVHFVVKRGNIFLGKRTFIVTNGLPVVDSTSPIPLGMGGSTNVEFGFYTDDSKRVVNSPFDVSLLKRILNAGTVAVISGPSGSFNVNSSRVNLYHIRNNKFGAMLRQWGQFMYNPKAVTGAVHVSSLNVNLIKEESLTLTDAQATVLQNLLTDGNQGPNPSFNTLQGLNIEDPNTGPTILDALNYYADSAGINNMPFLNASPSRDFEAGIYTDKWIGLHKECYSNAGGARAASMSQSFSFQSPTSVFQGDLNTGAYGIDKHSRGDGDSVSAGVGLGGFNASGSTSLGGSSRTVTDYIDLNGDRYPDIVSTGAVQYTKKTGGLWSSSGRGVFAADMSTDNSRNWGITAAGTYASSGKPTPGGDGKSAPSDGKLKSAKPTTTTNTGPSGSTGISGNFGKGESDTTTMWADINGDGLPDMLKKNGNTITAHLNLGNSNFSSNNVWGEFELGRGKSESFGGGLGYNNANGSLEAGISLGRTDSDTQEMLVDMNGDGLLDRVRSDNSKISITFNRGNKLYQNPIDISSFNMFNSASTTSANINGTGTYSFLWILYLVWFAIPFKTADVSVTASAGTSTNRTRKSISDFDGDGYADLIEEVGSNRIKIAHSRIRRTDMLKTVTNPLGGKFTVDYQVQPVTYNNPHAKWTMKSVVINDGYNKVNDGNDIYRKEFTYENGKYDRREREFYGYATVRATDYIYDANGDQNGTYRTNVTKYNNTSYFLNGLVQESYVIKGNNENAKYSRTINTYEIKKLNADNTEIIISSNEPATFDVGGKEGRRTGAVLLTKTKNEIYELQPTPQITTEVVMKYDAKGRISEYNDKGNLAFTSDDYTSSISYHNLNNNIISVPREIRVLVNNVEKRKRSTLVNATTGKIETIRAHLNSSLVATTKMQYDTYGNLNYIEYPQNYNGESMFYKYKYDEEYNKYIILTEDAFGYNSKATYDSNLDKVTETIDLAGNPMRYEYDQFGRTYRIIAPKEIEDGLKYTIQFKYYPKFADLPSGSGVTASTFVPVALTQHYDVAHEDTGNDIETITFIDGLARPIQIKKDITLNRREDHSDPEYFEAMSISGKTAYDSYGRAIEQFHPYFETKDNSTKFILNEYASSESSKTEYDELNRPIKSTDAADNISSMEYSVGQTADGILALKSRSVTDQNGSQSIVVESYKDIRDKVIATMHQGPSGAIWTTHNYTALGELVSYIDNEGLVTEYDYDNFGRKKLINHPDNGITSFDYDLANNLKSLQTANLEVNSQQIIYMYEYNRLTDIVFPQNPDGSDNISNVKYKYGSSGNNTGRLIHQKDATGEQYFQYGNMGEIIANKRIVVGPTPSMPVRGFETSYSYDSWNRIQEMIYPDGEKVNYNYDLGGNLSRMTGQVNDEPYNYIDRLDYDYFEQRAYIKYGNGTETLYKYSEDMRRLTNLNVKTSNGQDLYNNHYDYDYVGNVIRYGNSAGATDNKMAGEYSHRFDYDNLNRLISANGYFSGNPAQAELNNDYSSDYDLQMQYNTTHGILNKKQNHNKNGINVAENSYDNVYKYIEDTHKLDVVSNNITGSYDKYDYDNNGNIVRRSSSNGNVRSILWDESNRMRLLYDDPRSLQHYIYDASGERVLKANSDVAQTFQNGQMLDPASVTINNYTTYASAFLVVDGYGVYSKHYFAGTQRIVSRIGDQSSEIFVIGQGRGVDSEHKKLQELQVNDLNKMLEQVKLGKARFKDYKAYKYEELKAEIDKELQEEMAEKGEKTLEQPNGAQQRAEQAPIYFYHPDHLGTSTALTDINGVAYQFFLNLPFGETMAEQLPSTYYKTPYKFNGKELDDETGLYYYGARYYDPKVSIWLSVDPLMEKFPNFNPYVYCYQNPINIIDPTGMSGTDPAGDPPKKNIIIRINDGKKMNTDEFDTGAWHYISANSLKEANVKLKAYLGETKADNIFINNHGGEFSDSKQHGVIISKGGKTVYTEDFENYNSDKTESSEFQRNIDRSGVKDILKTASYVKDGGNFIMSACTTGSDEVLGSSLSSLLNHRVNLYLPKGFCNLKLFETDKKNISDPRGIFSKPITNLGTGWQKYSTGTGKPSVVKSIELMSNDKAKPIKIK